MKTTGATSTAAVVLTLIFVFIITVDAQPRARTASSSRTGTEARSGEISPILQSTRELSAATDRLSTTSLSSDSMLSTRIRSIRTIDFYLKDGKLVFGKLISEDRNKVMVEQVEGSKLIVATFSKRDIETRSLQAKNVSASKYYTDMGEYFAGRTWDFKDDPDDFIQAIRFLSRAKELIEGTSQLDNEKSKEFDKKIAELEADREVWTKQVETRAKLKELEFQAEYVARFSELEAKLNASTAMIDASVAQIDQVIADVKRNTESLDKNIPTMEQDLRNRLDILGREVDNNRRLLDPYGRTMQRNYGSRSRY